MKAVPAFISLKERPTDLAIAGAPAAFGSALHVGKPNIGSEETLLERFRDLFDRRWLTNNGPYAQEFGSRLAQFLGVKHCIPTCNATVALEIAVRASGMQGEVIVPSFTFVATAHALQWQQITPVFCDVAEDCHNLDTGQIEKLITPKTSGIIGVHVWGKACDVDGLSRIARRHNLGLLYDAAHAFGCSSNGRMIGNFGVAEVFSFHATKFLNSFEGGAIATNDDDLAARIRLMINFGFAGFDNVVHIGTNGKMSEVSAAMGLTSLESMDDFISVNKRNYETYVKELAGIAGLSLMGWDEAEKNNYQYVVVEIDSSATGIHRDELLTILNAENVIARRYFYPGCHRMEPYRSLFPDTHLRLPRTEALVQRVLVLPTGTAISHTDVLAVCSIVRTALRNGPECARMAKLYGSKR